MVGPAIQVRASLGYEPLVLWYTTYSRSIVIAVDESGAPASAQTCSPPIASLLLPYS